MSEPDLSALPPEEGVACVAARWNLTAEMARRRWRRESYHGCQTATEPVMKAAALWYAKKGIPVFPCHYPTGGGCSCGNPQCDSQGKHPLTPHGFKDATTDLAVIEAWWTKHPEANIAIPTGYTTRLLLVDTDPRNGGPTERAELVEQFGPIPDTAEAMTGGGGRHFVFHYPGGPVPKTLAEGIDLKGDGGYFLAAPSLHTSGKRYEWDGIENAKALLHPAELPRWLQQYISNPKPTTGTIGTIPHELSEIIQDGKKHNTIVSLIGTLKRRGFPKDAAFAACRALKFQTPVPDEDIWERLESCYRLYPPQASFRGFACCQERTIGNRF